MHIEFLGIPRERAGISDVVVDARTLGDVLRTLRERFPALAELMTSDGLHPSVAANLNGNTFIRDPATRLADDDYLLILSADVGG
jgi:molybdopterin converting factor small subunit